MNPARPAQIRLGIFYRDFGEPGGMPREVELLAANLQNVGVHTFVYYYSTTSGSLRKGANYSIRPIKYTRVLKNLNPVFIPSGMKTNLRDNLDQLDLLLIIGSFLPESAAIARLARRRNIPYVISCGDGFNPYLFTGIKGRLKRLYEYVFEARVLKGAAAIRLYSSAQVEQLSQRGHEVAGRTIIAKEGIDRAVYPKNRPTPKILSKPDPAFGFLGRLDAYQKGLDVLLEGWKLYESSGGHGHLTLVGPHVPRSTSKLTKRAKDLRLRNFTVSPPLYADERLAYLEHLSVFVHPSRHEGIPRAVREALAAGRPVIVTSGTNLGDIVVDHGAGWVVDLDPGSLANTFLMAEGTDLQALQRGAIHAAASLEWERIVLDLRDEFVRLVYGRTSSS